MVDYLNSDWQGINTCLTGSAEKVTNMSGITWRRQNRPWARRALTTATVLVSALVLTAQQAMAITHTEIGDAPSLPPGQAPVGSGALDSISGSLGPGDFEDLYRICVIGNTFSATTIGGATFDTQLFLFFAENGKGAAQGTVTNDDSSVYILSTLPPGGTSLTNGGTLNYPPGVYYLAISGFDRDPVSGENLMFLNAGGAVGPSPDVGPLTGWSGDGEVGSYTITLTGATAGPCGK